MTLEGAENSQARVCVKDDGCGFDRRTVASKGGVGLIGMEERMRQIGGEFTLESAPGGGTLVTAVVSLPPEQRRAQQIERVGQWKLKPELTNSSPRIAASIADPRSFGADVLST